MNLLELPHAFQMLATGAVGLMVGSFLNVAIHRLPLEDESVSRPRRSRCPKCRRTLTWRENVPVFSWLWQRGRCRSCGWRIPVRYPLVELLTAGLWVLAAWLTPWEQGDLLAVHLLVVSGLLVATFVDFDCYEIPDEVSIGGMVLAPVLSFLVPALHEHTWLAQELSEGGDLTRRGAVTGCLAGMAVGGGVLIAAGQLGKLVFRKDAMGWGDVKLLAAGGGFVGPGGALLALMAASVLGSVVGLWGVLRYSALSLARARRRRGALLPLRALRVGRRVGEYVPFGPYLGMGIGIALFAWNDVVRLFT